MAPDNRYYDDDTTQPTAVRYGGTCTTTYPIGIGHKEEEDPGNYYELEELEYRKIAEAFAVKNFNNALPSKAYVKHVEIKQKRFKQKMR